MLNTSFHPSIIREYDIRGIVGDTLHTKDAYYLGRAFVTSLLRQGLGKHVVVGFDGRLTSPAMEEALVKGLRESGAEVTRIGLGPTPMLYFAAHQYQSDGAIMVTGSHNPKDHNGFKMLYQTNALFGSQIQALATIAASGEFEEGQGSVAYNTIEDAFVEVLKEGFVPKSQNSLLGVGWDAGNGAAGEIIEALCRVVPGKHVGVNTTIDGNFPVHHPDPSVPENLVQLQQLVKDKRLNVGLAFDGDGDRLGVIDEKGRIVTGDQLLALFAKSVLEDNAGATIIADVKASQMVFDTVKDNGGEPLMWRTGHSLIKAKMKEVDAAFAGEVSGHIFFNDRYFGYDDGIYAAIRLLTILAETSEPLSSLIDALPKLYSTDEMRLPCRDDQKFDVVQHIQDSLRKQQIPFNDIDGVRMQSEDGWWLIRASNTQPALVARAEGYDKARLQVLLSHLGQELSKEGIMLPK